MVPQLTRRLRVLSRRLPIASSYERRIDELSDEVQAMTVQIRRMEAAAEAVARAAAAAEAARPKPWVPLGHYYSPIPDVDALQADHERLFGGDPLDLPGIDLDLDAQWDLLEQLAGHADEVQFRPGRRDRCSPG